MHHDINVDINYELTKPLLTGWDLSRCCYGRIPDSHYKRSFQPEHLCCISSEPGGRSGTAGDSEKKCK